MGRNVGGTNETVRAWDNAEDKKKEKDKRVQAVTSETPQATLTGLICLNTTRVQDKEEKVGSHYQAGAVRKGGRNLGKASGATRERRLTHPGRSIRGFERRLS